jgi:hypothetical protein
VKGNALHRFLAAGSVKWNKIPNKNWGLEIVCFADSHLKSTSFYFPYRADFSIVSIFPPKSCCKTFFSFTRQSSTATLDTSCSIHHHINQSATQSTQSSSHRHIDTSTRQHIKHINTSTSIHQTHQHQKHQHINRSTHKHSHTNTSTDQHNVINTSTQCHQSATQSSTQSSTNKSVIKQSNTSSNNQ